MEIVDANGKPVNHIETGAKKEHESREYRKEAARLENLFNELQQEFLQDMTGPDPRVPVKDKSVTPTWSKIRQSYGRRWKDQAIAINKSSKPIEVNEERMFEFMDAWKKQVDMEAAGTKPLHDLTDEELAAFDLEVVWEDEAVGRVIVTSAFVLCLLDNRTVRVDPFFADTNTTAFIEHFSASEVHQTAPFVLAKNYTFQELHLLMNGLRRLSYSKLTEAQKAQVRHNSQ